MISPSFATLLVFVQTDAQLSRRECDLLLGVTRQALVRADQRRRPAVDLRHRDPPGVRRLGRRGSSPRPRTSGRFGEALDAALRQLALMVVRDGEGARRVGRVVVRGGDERVVDAGRARGRRLAAGQDRAVRRRRELGPDHPGGRRGAAGDRAAGGRHRDRGDPASARAAATSPHDAAALEGGGRSATRSSTRSTLPGEGGETELFFSDLGHEYVTINADYTT